ncbi:MAG: hypothetical protein IKJ65_05745 [Clostridia bacterium]|nr:hypothetical protein [Clostridia bacterium]
MLQIKCAKTKKTKGVLIWPASIRRMRDDAPDDLSRTPTNLKDVFKKHAHVKKTNISEEEKT